MRFLMEPPENEAILDESEGSEEVFVIIYQDNLDHAVGLIDNRVQQ